MNIFITGGTGFVGQEILRQLHAAGHTLHVLVREATSHSAIRIRKEYSTILSVGDIVEPCCIGTTLNGIDAVIHLVGIISEVGKSTFEAVHASGTANIISAAKQARVNRFLHMSALGTRPQARSRYHQSKWQGEQIVQGSELDFTIFRPSIIYGRGDLFINRLGRLSRFSPIVPVLGGGETMLQPISVEAVAQSFVTALNEPKSSGETYDLCGPEVFSFNSLVDTLLSVLGRKRLKVYIPLQLANVVANTLQLVFRGILRQPAPLTRDQLLMLEEDNVGDCTRADQLFGLRHEPFRTGIARYMTAKLAG